MIVRPSVRMLVVAALFLSAPGFAFTLKPGTYKLQWTVPPNQFGGFYNYSSEFSKSDEMAPRLKGVRSKRVLNAAIDGFWFFLDESRGTGRGYDTVYVSPVDNDTGEPTATSISGCVRVAMHKFGDKLMPRKSDGAPVEIKIGPKGSQVVKKAALDLLVDLRPGARGKLEPYQIEMKRRGNWRGKLQSDSGDVVVETQDQNSNGVYGDWISKDDDGDAISYEFWSTFNGKRVKDNAVVTLGRAVLIDDGLYSITVSPLGDTVTVAPFAGPVGQLSVKALDGSNNPGKPYLLTVRGADLELQMLQAVPDTISIPAGIYSEIGVVIAPLGTKGMDVMSGVPVRSKRPLEIKPDTLTTVTLGGPVTIEIGSGEGVITAKAGQSQSIPVRIMVGSEPLGGNPEDRPAIARITDETGKVVYKSAIGSSYDPDNLTVQLPTKLKPGNYTLTVTLDLQPYQPPVAVSKKVVVGA